MSKTISIQSVDSVGTPIKETKVRVVKGVAKCTMLVYDKHDTTIVDNSLYDYREAVDGATIGIHEFHIIVDQD